jgi:hypothetical protein
VELYKICPSHPGVDAVGGGEDLGVDFLVADVGAVAVRWQQLLKKKETSLMVASKK